jgi:hypothetical protein
MANRTYRTYLTARHLADDALSDPAQLRAIFAALVDALGVECILDELAALARDRAETRGPATRWEDPARRWKAIARRLETVSAHRVARKLGLDDTDALEALHAACPVGGFDGRAVAQSLRRHFAIPDDEPHLGRALAERGILTEAEGAWLDDRD